MRFSPYDMHMKGLATSAGSEAKKIAVVRELPGTFLAGDVDGHGNTLPVRVIDLQRRVLTLGKTLLIHQTAGGIAEGQEAVVVLVERITVAGERAHKELQLVVSALADLYADTPESVLQMIRAALQVGIGGHGNNEVEMAIDELLVLAGYQLLHFLDVLDGYLIAGIGK